MVEHWGWEGAAEAHLACPVVDWEWQGSPAERGGQIPRLAGPSACRSLKHCGGHSGDPKVPVGREAWAVTGAEGIWRAHCDHPEGGRMGHPLGVRARGRGGALCRKDEG